MSSVGASRGGTWPGGASRSNSPRNRVALRGVGRRSLSLLGAMSVLALLVLFACSGAERQDSGSGTGDEMGGESSGHGKMAYQLTAADTTGLAKAIFAGGCFWCLETAFEGVPGVHAAISGFAGGSEPHPTYEQVSSGSTHHAESVLVTYDPTQIDYDQLLHIFWTNHDPLSANGQFCDRGRQYRPAIFYLDETQHAAAEASVEWARAHLQRKGEIVTEITGVTDFWPAEEYHQDFWKKDPGTYKSYRRGCGRDARLHDLWGDLAIGH